MSEGMFETPNTRSRRKREDDAMASGSSGSKQLGSQEDERVVWVHDQRLRRAVLSATEHVELAPPTPTQRPRPLSSSRAVGSAGSTSSRPPRKRPCRNSRSELNGSGSKGKPGSSSSMPDSSASEVKLDLLLQRFELLSTPLAPSRASMFSIQARTGSAGVLRETSSDNHNTIIPMTPDLSSPITRSTTLASLGKPLLNTNVNINNVRSGLMADSPLRSRTTNSVASGRHVQKPFPTGHQKPFKPPLLNPPTRASPRHLRTNNTIPPSPLRASIAAPTRTATLAPIHVAETPCRGKVRKHNANVDIGEDDPAGDSSFDSFDGMFQDGGPEIEQLLKTVDGSQ